LINSSRSVLLYSHQYSTRQRFLYLCSQAVIWQHFATKFFTMSMYVLSMFLPFFCGHRHLPTTNAITSPLSEADYDTYNKGGGMIAVGT
jgi:hypothetical protein